MSWQENLDQSKNMVHTGLDLFTITSSQCGSVTDLKVCICQSWSRETFHVNGEDGETRLEASEIMLLKKNIYISETLPAFVGPCFYTNCCVWHEERQETTEQHIINVCLLPWACGYLIPLLKVWCNLKRACGEVKKTLATLWIMLAFSMQVKIWFVSHHQTQTLQYITFPLGLYRLCHHQPRFCNDNQSSIITFQVHDLNDIVRAPKTDWHSLHPPCVLLDLKPDRSCIWSTFHSDLSLLDTDLTPIICSACPRRPWRLRCRIRNIKMTYLDLTSSST